MYKMPGIKFRLPTINLKDIEPILWNMECILRNKEGITGINAMHHINLFMLIRILDKPMCKKLDIPEEWSLTNLITLNSNELFNIMIQNDNSIISYFINNNTFGFSDIAFEIKNKSTLVELLIKVNEIDNKYINKRTDFIGNIYESFINKEGSTMKNLGQFFTDRDIINYLVKLANPKLINGKIEKVYDGAAGTGGFLTEYINYLNKTYKNINWEHNKYNIYGNDINKNTFCLLKLNMFFSTHEIIENICLNDSLSIDNCPIDGFDVILMNPPFGIKGLKYTNMNNKIKSLGINSTKGEVLFLQHCMVNLAKGGRCCIVIPEGLLYNSTKSFKETRQYLLENFNVKKIIKLGTGNFFRNTGCKVSILYFVNDGTSTKNISFIDIDKINNKIKETVKYNINIDAIKYKNYSLNINLYKESNIKCNPEHKIMKLEDICTIKTGKNIPKYNRNGTMYPYYGSNGISGFVDSYLYDGNYLLHGDQGSVLNSLKYVSGKFYPGNHTLVIKPKDSSINIKYLYYYIKLLVNIKEILSGTVIPEIRSEDFKNIDIIVPNIELQNILVSKLDALNKTLNITLLEPREILIKSLNKYNDEIETKGKEILQILTM